MSSSDRRIAAARKIDQDAPKPLDTWPAPPPSHAGNASSPDDTDKHDTIPTPAPESGTAEVVAIPPLRNVNLDGR
jgi:hypothetical protein